MGDRSTPCPADWSEVSDPDGIMAKYDPRPVTLFTCERREVGIHALPAEPNSPHADTSEYRLDFVEGGDGDWGAPEPFARAPDFQAALSVAETFMEAFDAAAGDRRAAAEDAMAAAGECEAAEPVR